MPTEQQIVKRALKMFDECKHEMDKAILKPEAKSGWTFRKLAEL